MRRHPRSNGKGPITYSDDLTKKVCKCPLHNGELVPVGEFGAYKSGPRKGLLYSTCTRGKKIEKGLDPNLSGLVHFSSIRFVFEELSYRLGKVETCRQLGLSHTFWHRHKNGNSPRLHKKTAAAAIALLMELREADFARHKDSIKHGAKLRGRQEKIPTQSKHFNGPDVHANERRRNWANENPEREAANQARNTRRRQARRDAERRAITA